MDNRYFTDSEYRLLLSALSREKKICKEIDGINNESSLTKMVNNIEKKIKFIQYDLIKQLEELKKAEADREDYTEDDYDWYDGESVYYDGISDGKYRAYVEVIRMIKNV